MVKVTVCIGSSCHLKGSRRVVEDLQCFIREDGLGSAVDLGGAFCVGKCGAEGVSVMVDGVYYPVEPDKTRAFFDAVVAGKARGAGGGDSAGGAAGTAA